MNKPPARANEKWSKAEEEIVVQRFVKNVEIDRIAELHGRTAGAIQSKLCNLGYMQRSGTGYVPVERTKHHDSWFYAGPIKRHLLLLNWRTH